ncbi:restriction endonuclease [Salinisphaera sp.]|uniref:restriction endonuclease n=1 Tax=Salinisphaera sp. TaxID=1914330 RepID=UPI0025E49E9D|nr:restriction endonuclease [Salinisphaera sp.]
MARRRRKSNFEVWVELFAKLPWAVCLALAPIAYLGFAALVDWPMPQATNPAQISDVFIAQLIRTAGLFGQYIGPTILCLAALMSFLGKRRRRKLLATARAAEGAGPILQMGWQEFEQCVHAWFEEQGYRVAATPAGPDGGIDLILKRDGERLFVQCKHWRASRIGVAVVRELYGVMVAEGATGGFVVGVGDFTSAAQEFANGRNIELVDASRVIALREANTAGTPSTSAPPQAPACPRCQAPMVERIARKGTNAGRAFHGCSRFPACRATRAIEHEPRTFSQAV